MLTALSVIIGMGFLTFMQSLFVHSGRVDFYTHQEAYTRMAIRDGLMWPRTFVRVVSDYIQRVK